MKRIIIICTIIISLASLSIYGILINQTDGKKFKQEYEQYNKIKSQDKEYINLNINKKNPMIYLDNEIIKNFKGKDKLIFIASPNNNNSRKAVKILLNLAEEIGIEEIYYYNSSKIKKELDTYKDLLKELKQEEFINPTLLLIKNEKVEEIYQSKEINEKEMKEKYERILIKYTLCTKECK